MFFTLKFLIKIFLVKIVPKKYYSVNSLTFTKKTNWTFGG